MIEDHLNQITLCADGEIRLLNKITEAPPLLHYSVPIDIRNSKRVWMPLSGTRRGAVLRDFLDGEIITEEDWISENQKK